jgi:hypothetical protein
VISRIPDPHRTPTPQIALMGPTSTLHCVLLRQAAFFANEGVGLVHAVLEAPEPSCAVLGPVIWGRS